MKPESKLLSIVFAALITLLLSLPVISNSQTYDIYIWTTEGGLPLGDVTVVLDGETIVTSGGPMGGEAIFTGKAPGTYPYTASKAGYVTYNGTVTVVDQNASDFAVMVPALYDIFIWTTEGGLPLGDVTVVLDGETIVTSGGPMGGEAIFTGKAPGTYPYTASKAGYVTYNGTVTVVDQNASDFAVMVPALYDIFIWTTEGGLPLGDVTVVLDGETIVTSGGPMGGEAIFTGKAPGTYPYTASKAGYVTYNGSVTVVDQNASDFAVMVPALYDIFIWTTEGGLPLGDVTVVLDGETIVTSGGPMGGEAIFTGKAPGTYPYTASKAGYVTYNGSVTVVDQNVGDFAPMEPAIFNISFMCSENGVPGGLEGVNVTIDGFTVVSDADGLALFEDYLPGTYNYIANKSGYVVETGTVTIVDQDITEYIELDIAYYDMLIWCYEAGDPAGLPGVDVTIDGVTVTTDNTGLAWFNDYQSGTYYYTASKDGYITESGSITIINTTASTNVILTPNAFDMFFWCSESGNPMGLSDVEVTIDGVTITSDFDGLAVFENYEPGTYNYTATKEGYTTESGTVTITNFNVEEYVVLSSLYTVTFVVDNGLELIEGVEVVFDGITEFTNEEGEAYFEDIESGTYEYTISIDGYIIQGGTVDVENNNVTVPITLVISNLSETIFEDIVIYPNPSSGSFYLSNAEATVVQVFDHTGNVIYYNTNGTHEINLTDKPAGVYNVILRSDTSISSRKILIVR